MKKLITLFLTTMICLCLLGGCGSKTVSIDLSDYMNVLFRGSDGSGTARADFDYSGFEKAIMASSKEGEGALSNILKLESTMTLSVSPNKNLKNGDKVTMTVNFDKEAAKNAGASLSGGSKDFTVSGLGVSGPEATPGSQSASADTQPSSVELDAFDPAYWNTKNGIVISYEGISPYGWLEIKNNLPAENPLSKVNYTFSEHRNVHEGDTLTVSVSFSDSRMKNSYYFKELTGSYTVGRIDHYLMDTAELDAAAVTFMKTSAKNIAADSISGLLEFRTADDYQGFYNGEAVTVNVNEAGSYAYAIRTTDGFIEAIAVPACLNVTVQEPDWMESPKTYEYDLVILSVMKDIVVHADGTVTVGTAEFADKGTADAENKMLDYLKTGFGNPVVEKFDLN